MPVRFTIDHAERYVTVRAEGIVLLDEILDYFDALVIQNAMPYRKLFDAGPPNRGSATTMSWSWARG